MALGALAVACAVLPAAFGRSWFIWVGWLLQDLLIATGALVPLMFILGIVSPACGPPQFISGRNQARRRPPVGLSRHRGTLGRGGRSC